MSKDQFNKEILTESVIGIYKHMSVKALFIELTDGTGKWIPKSVIRNYEQFDHSNTEFEQCFEIDLWFTRKYQLDIEL